jgi:AraC-like DNA-binding protein
MPHWSLRRAAASTQLMIRVAAEQGLDFAACVAGTGLTAEDLGDPAREIEGQQELGVLRNILRALDPSVPFGLIAGARYHLSTHGMWGFAMISSPTIRRALDFSLRYFDLSYSFNRFSVVFETGQARLIYDDSDNPEDLRAVLVERDMAAAVTFGRDVFGRMIPIKSLQLRGRRPAHVHAYEPLFGVQPTFNAQGNSLCIDAAWLDVPHPLADEMGLRVCEEQCRALIERRGVRSGVAGRVRARILAKPGEFPRLTTVAAELGMSTRTLRNQLDRETTSYRELLEEIRETLAEQLLSSTRMSLNEIAERLGYADASSFTAAFKRWKGISPRVYKMGNGIITRGRA